MGKDKRGKESKSKSKKTKSRSGREKKDRKKDGGSRRREEKKRPQPQQRQQQQVKGKADLKNAVKGKAPPPQPTPSKTPASSEHKHRRHRGGRDNEGGDIQSPDDVAVLVGDRDEEGNLLVHIQLEAAQDVKSYLKGLLQNICYTLIEVKSRKYTFLYLVTLAVAIALGIYFGYLLKGSGIPPTSEAADALTRFIVSLILIFLLSPIAMYIINVKVTNLGLGVIWMFLVVSLQYFVAITISKSSVFLSRYNDPVPAEYLKGEVAIGLKHSNAFDDVLQYIYQYYFSLPPNVNPNEANPNSLLQSVAEAKGCCDFEIKSIYDGKEYTSFWDAVFRNSTINYRPYYCCGKSQSNVPCTATSPGVSSKPKCDREDVLDIIESLTVKSLISAIVLEAACVGMALIFLYYYSDIQAQDLANEQIPGDFEFLHLNRPHLAGQVVELSEKEKLRRQRKKRRLSKMKEIFGVDQAAAAQVYPHAYPGAGHYDQQAYAQQDQQYAQHQPHAQQHYPQQQQEQQTYQGHEQQQYQQQLYQQQQYAQQQTAEQQQYLQQQQYPQDYAQQQYQQQPPQ